MKKIIFKQAQILNSEIHRLTDLVKAMDSSKEFIDSKHHRAIIVGQDKECEEIKTILNWGRYYLNRRIKSLEKKFEKLGN